MPQSSAFSHLGKDRADAVVTGLNALGWIASEPERLHRMLALTGLSPDQLRTRADDPSLLGAVLSFLEGHQPDLIACADATGLKPEELVRAREALER